MNETQHIHASQKMQTAPLRPSDVDFMPPLLRSLATLIKLRGRHVSPQFLLAGLAGAEKVSVGACLRSAERAGLKGRVLHRPKLEQVSALTLPCILLLKNEQCCVYLGVEKSAAPSALAQAAGQAAPKAEGELFARVILPELDDSEQHIPLEKLEELYSGYAIFATLESRADARTEALRSKEPRRWFWDVFRSFAPIYRHVALASVVVNVIAVASSLFVMNVYDRVIPNSAHETLWVLAAGVGIAYLFDFILRSLRSHFVDLAGRNADVVLSSRLVDKVLSMRLDAKPESTGALVNNLREFESLREFFSSTTFLALIDLPFLALFLLLLWVIGGPLVLVPLAAIPFLLGAGLWLQMAARRSAEKNYRHAMQKNALLVEMVHGLETVKSSMAEARMQKLWEAVAGISAQSGCESRKYSTRAVTLATFTTQMVTVVMVVWGVYRITGGEMSMGGLIGCNILVGRIMAPLLQLASLLTRLQNSRVSLKALDTLMALPSENQDQAACMDFGQLEPEFVMQNVSFAYPGAAGTGAGEAAGSAPQPGSLALDSVSLRIRRGEKVAIIGKMGSGKSTLGKLLIGLYQPTEGQVSFGGVDIRQLATADLRSRVGFLPQEVVLFYGSVRDNIALGDPTITDQLVLRAARIAGAEDFVRRHPAGFGAQVGEQGRNLSGGQRQAVGLARALVRDPDVLILDEPSSNMDVDTERVVQERLAAVTRDKTLILITHRLSMLRMVERVIVVESGKILMDGPRDKVLAALRERSGAKPGPAAPVKPGAPAPGRPQTSPAAPGAGNGGNVGNARPAAPGVTAAQAASPTVPASPAPGAKPAALRGVLTRPAPGGAPAPTASAYPTADPAAPTLHAAPAKPGAPAPAPAAPAANVTASPAAKAAVKEA